MTFKFFGAAVASALLATSAAAHDFTSGDLTIDHPIVRINIGDRPSAGFMTIENAGALDDRLVAASSPSFGHIELHTHIVEDGVARMREIDGVAAPAGGAVVLEPGGLHLMFFEPDESVATAAFLNVTLTFEAAGDVDVVFMTRSLAEMGGAHESAHESAHGDGDHGAHGHADHGGTN